MPGLVLPAEKRKQICRHMGTAALTVYPTAQEVFYTNLLTRGRLNGYLANVNEQANYVFRLVKQTAEREGITEKLKAEQLMEWVGKMNALREAAAEIVNAEVIFCIKQRHDESRTMKPVTLSNAKSKGGKVQTPYPPESLCLKNGLTSGIFSLYFSIYANGRFKKQNIQVFWITKELKFCLLILALRL